MRELNTLPTNIIEKVKTHLKPMMRRMYILKTDSIMLAQVIV